MKNLKIQDLPVDRRKAGSKIRFRSRWFGCVDLKIQNSRFKIEFRSVVSLGDEKFKDTTRRDLPADRRKAGLRGNKGFARERRLIVMVSHLWSFLSLCLYHFYQNFTSLRLGWMLW